MKPGLAAARRALRGRADAKKARVHRSYFKNPGRDVFWGVAAADARTVAREFSALKLSDVRVLMRSKVHDERGLGHAILVRRFETESAAEKKTIFDFYRRNLRLIFDWDAVDGTAPYIMGPSLRDKDKGLLYRLARSRRLWDRRIALLSTWPYIRGGDFKDALALLTVLLDDEEDLIHKACGWMLREIGKRDLAVEKAFLRRHLRRLPRTALRYAIERFPERDRRAWLRIS